MPPEPSVESSAPRNLTWPSGTKSNFHLIMTTAFLTRASLTVALAAGVRRGCGTTISRHICKKGHHLGGRTTVIRTMGVGASCRSGGGEEGGWTCLSFFRLSPTFYFLYGNLFVLECSLRVICIAYLRIYDDRLSCFCNFCVFPRCCGGRGRLSSLSLSTTTSKSRPKAVVFSLPRPCLLV